MTNINQTLQDLGISCENHLLPFYWQQGNHHERIPRQIEDIQTSGAQAFCVESRTHEDFMGDGWWDDMDLILSEAQKRSMKVWILDDKHFPTGYANGIIEKSFPELRSWQFIERHVDVFGPQKNVSLLVEEDTPEEQLLAVYAYPRHEFDEVLEDRPVDLTRCVQGRFLRWNLPEGLWRVFFIFRSRKGHFQRQTYYIDMMRKESVKCLIDAVYEPHFQRYARYFGNTLAGFFSDEPGIGNDYFTERYTSGDNPNGGFYENKIGVPGMGYPYGDELTDEIKAVWGKDWLSRIPALWYPMGKATSVIRQQYMNLVTRRYRDCFVRQLGDWCRGHNVQYIGHIIEDQGNHAHLGQSGGHYFRAEDGQSMAGMDVVLHQIVPGMGHFRHTASGAGSYYDGPFFEYLLPKMCASASHLNPVHHGQAMCEVFGAFGWAEGVPYMKWLMDYLLVCGINQFVPHAFSPNYPNEDCPPHFGAEGHDPQFPAFRELMVYSNRIASLLDGMQHVTSAALLYHAEAEWGAISPKDFMPDQLPAMKLTDGHVDFDIVPIDAIMAPEAIVQDCRLVLAGESYPCLVIPGAKHLPAEFLETLHRMQGQGLPIFFVEQAPEDCPFIPAVLPLESLHQHLRARGFCEIHINGQGPLDDLRHYHVRRPGREVFFVVNQSVNQYLDITLTLPVQGRYAEMDVAADQVFGGVTASGEIPLLLAPGESRVLVFDESLPEYPSRPAVLSRKKIVPEVVTVELAASEDLSQFKPYCKGATLPDITAEMPDFSGYIRYSFDLTLDEVPASAMLDLGEVGQTANLVVNGKDFGWRYAKPVMFPMDGSLKKGVNHLEITVANTLVNKEKDYFSTFLQIPPSGLFGPMTLVAFK